jgi:hypothetical protein
MHELLLELTRHGNAESWPFAFSLFKFHLKTDNAKMEFLWRSLRPFCI